MARETNRPPASDSADSLTAADPDQYRRFLEAARDLGCEENMDRLDGALRRVAKAPPQPRPDHPRPKKKRRA